jgi:hypothetical protein
LAGAAAVVVIADGQHLEFTGSEVWCGHSEGQLISRKWKVDCANAIRS